MVSLHVLSWLLAIPLVVAAPKATTTTHLSTTVQPPLSTTEASVAHDAATSTTTKKKKKTTKTTTTPTTTQPSSTPTSSTSTQTSSTPMPSSCQAVGNNTKYTDSNGFRYNVTCGAIQTGTQLEYQPVANFQTCFNFCDNIQECEAFNYFEASDGSGSGNCSFLHARGTLSAKAGVDAAFMIAIIT